MAFRLKSRSSVKKGGFKFMGSSPLKMHEGKPHSNDFVYGDWEEVGREVGDAGVTTISERRSGERDVEYSKRGVDWKVGYEKWLAAGNKGSLSDFKIEANRWKKSQTRTETDVQSRQRMLEAEKREELKQMTSKQATIIKQPAGSTTKDKNIVVSKSNNVGGRKSNVSASKDSKKQSSTVSKTIRKKNSGSGPPPSGSSTSYSHPQVRVDNTRSTKSQASEKGDINTYTNAGSLKYPDSPGDNTYSTSVTTSVFKPKVFGSGTRKRGVSITTGETLNADGTVRDSHSSKKRIKR